MTVCVAVAGQPPTAVQIQFPMPAYDGWQLADQLMASAKAAERNQKERQPRRIHRICLYHNDFEKYQKPKSRETIIDTNSKNKLRTHHQLDCKTKAKNPIGTTPTPNTRIPTKSQTHPQYVKVAIAP
jgi:hypothetical protein